MTRRFRIAVSLFFGVLMVSLCVLWVRSYRVRDTFEKVTSTRLLHFHFERGEVVVMNIDLVLEPREGRALLDELKIGQMHSSRVVSDDSFFFVGSDNPNPRLRPSRTLLGFGWRRGGTVLTEIFVPWWSLLVISIIPMVATMSLRSTNFGLRTMFAATMLVAAALGLARWLVT